MTPQEWQRVRPVLEMALELDPESRSQYLESTDLEEPLRLEVQLMIQLHEEAGTKLLNSPAVLDVIGENTTDVQRGQRIGPYEIQDEIGHGGMGAVYRAKRADGQFDQAVALKIVRGGIAAALAVTRFRKERQILAGLDHPNIAKLFDGGTTSLGLPYFVMEFVDGLPITDYCERNNLGTATRLELFLAVCSAVQYAHQHLVIHRDIKPSNIFVTKDAIPKLLDFGIATVLDPALQAQNGTIEGRWMMTPEYASPEQIRGEMVTTATDVYSLGLVLYQMLTGRYAYEISDHAPHEVARVICEDEPEVLSARVSKADSTKTRKEFRGDLSNILAMALQKDPARRYWSVEQFADDLRRYLRREPVIAHNATSWYRCTKFVARHKSAVAAAAVVCLTILAGLGTTLYEARVAREQAEIAREQHARAERRFDDVRKLANSLLFEIHDSIKDLHGAMPARKLLVERALQYLDSLSQESAGDQSLQRELAAAYDRVGDVQGSTASANLGDFPGALISYNKALAIRKAAADANPHDAQMQSDLLSDYFRMSFVLQDSGDFNEAIRYLDAGLLVAAKLAAANPNPENKEALAGFYWKKGNVLAAMNQHPGALAAFRQGLSIRKTIALVPGANPLSRVHLGADYLGVAKELRRTGDDDQAAQYAKAALDSFEPTARANPDNATYREYLAEMYDQSAPVFEDDGDADLALRYSQRSVGIFANLLSANPTDALARDNAALSELDLGGILLRHQQASEAIPHFRKAIADLDRIQHKNMYNVLGVVDADFELGEAYILLADHAALSATKQHNLLAARSWFQKSLKNSNGSLVGDAAYATHSRDDIQQAIARCTRALTALRPDDPSTPLTLDP